MAGTLQRLMKQWISYSLSLVPKGDKARIESWLMQPAKKSRFRRLKTWRDRQIAALYASGTPSRGKKFRAASGSTGGGQMSGTRAAAIVVALDLYHARSMKRADQLLRAEVFVRRRKASANTLRGGLIDPLRKLKGSAGGGARHKNSPHELKEQALDDFARIVVETWASARKTKRNRSPMGIRGKAGDVFLRKMGDLHKTVEKWYAERVIRTARKAGLQSPAPQ